MADDWGDDPIKKGAPPAADWGNDPLNTDTPAKTTPTPHTTASGLAGSIERGIAPVATGAAVGAAAGAPFGGVGAIPGAIAGAGAVGLTELATGVYNKLAPHMGWSQTATPQEMTDRVLDAFGVKRPTTGTERVVENTAAGAAGALGGVGAARTVADAATGPVTKAVAGKLAERPVAQAVSGALSGGATQSTAEAGFGPTAQTVAGLAAGALPYGKEGVLATAKSNARPEARDAIKSGYVMSPAEIPPLGEKPGIVGSLFSSPAGKIKLQQEASTKNQINTNQLAATGIGLHPDAHLNDKSFAQAEAPAAAVYRAVEKAVPEVELSRDQEYQNAVDAIGGRKGLVEKFFPDMADNPDIEKLRKTMAANGSVPTEVAMRKIADLRFQAGQNFRVVGDAQKHSLGLAQREAANALESATERAVQNAPDYYQRKLDQATKWLDFNLTSRTNQGLSLNSPIMTEAQDEVDRWTKLVADAQADNKANQKLLDGFRDARKLFAKINTVRDATNQTTGDVSAAGLARAYNKGAPLTDQLKTIADAYNTAPKDMQVPALFGRSEDWSALDFFGTSAAILHGNPAVALGILARPVIRKGLLSPAYQGAVAGLPSKTGSIGVLPLLTGPIAGPVQGATQGMNQP
jgi:hypothetical protein